MAILTCYYLTNSLEIICSTLPRTSANLYNYSITISKELYKIGVIIPSLQLMKPRLKYFKEIPQVSLLVIGGP